MQQWPDVARLIDALQEKNRETPEVRYTRARAAISLGQHALAVRLLAGLEAKLPLLAKEIGTYRAEAQLEAGPFDEAAKYFLPRGRLDDLVKAARAFERAGELDRARAAADQAVARAAAKKVSPARAAAARALRATLAELQGDKARAAADWRWLALQAPTAPEATDADDRLAKLSPKQPLTKQQRYDRALAMARAAQLEPARRELDRLATAPGPAIPRGELLHVEGWAYYMSRADYSRAATLLTQAAETGAKYKVKDLFYAARATSRAHRDEEAIGLYLDIAQRFPASNFAQDARFRAARLRYILGQWDKAIAAYDDYLKRYPSGSHRTTARYDRAVAQLAGGHGGTAAQAFEKLIPGQTRSVLQASYRELKGVALAQAGKKEAAVKELSRVVAEEPLSLPALLATARLRELGAPLPPPIPPPPAPKPREALVVKLPAKVRLLQSMGLDADAEAELSRIESTIRKAYGERGHEAVCQAYAELAGAAHAFREGRRAARWRALEQAPSATTRWLWDCMYPRPYSSFVAMVEKEHELSPHLIYAVMRQESAFEPAVVSPANAIGLMQVIPTTGKAAAAELGIEYQPELMVSPPYNIKLGAYYLSKVLTRFGQHPALAAASYNAGPSAVSRWLQTGEKLSLDVFVARIPYRETRLYVNLVMGNLAHYAYLEGGEAAIPRLELTLPQGLRATGDDY
jgi:soluble lytic murein transglycosylase